MRRFHIHLSDLLDPVSYKRLTNMRNATQFLNNNKSHGKNRWPNKTKLGGINATR